MYLETRASIILSFLALRKSLEILDARIPKPRATLKAFESSKLDIPPSPTAFSFLER